MNVSSPNSSSTGAVRNLPRRLRVIHFVSGGFSGATKVALDLVRHGRNDGEIEPCLVLRRKRGTPLERVAALHKEGLEVEIVPGWPHVNTVWHLKRLCDRLQADVLVAHGFSEHLDGRYAALLAGIPMIHVEHNSRERYTPWRLAQARWLARRTQAIVGCSKGVETRLRELGFPADKIVCIPNGIRLEPFSGAAAVPWTEREPALVMAARFSKQKDHATLLRALALLKQEGLVPRTYFAGGGDGRHELAARSLCAGLGLGEQVSFLGQVDNVPSLLMRSQVCVLSTHYEGMPLALLEGMAAGCVVVGSAVTGVKELINDGVNGLLAHHEDPTSLARALRQALEGGEQSKAMAHAGRLAACAQHSVERMVSDYSDLIVRAARHSA